MSRKIPREVNDDTVVDLLKDILLFPEAKVTPLLFIKAKVILFVFKYLIVFIEVLGLA